MGRGRELLRINNSSSSSSPAANWSVVTKYNNMYNTMLQVNDREEPNLKVLISVTWQYIYIYKKSNLTNNSLVEKIYIICLSKKNLETKEGVDKYIYCNFRTVSHYFFHSLWTLRLSRLCYNSSVCLSVNGERERTVVKVDSSLSPVMLKCELVLQELFKRC